MEERKFKVGDKVRITSNEETYFKVGDIADVITVDDETCTFQYKVSDEGKSDWLMESQINLASEPDTYTGLELVTMLATEILADRGFETIDCRTWFTDEGFENLEDPDKVKQLFEKVIETEES